MMPISLVKNLAANFKYRNELQQQTNRNLSSNTAENTTEETNLQLTPEQADEIHRQQILKVTYQTGFWGKLEQFLNNYLGINLAASRQQELKTVSKNVFLQLPDHYQLTKDTDKTLYQNSRQNYIIRQEGFEMFVYPLNSYKRYHKNAKDKCSLVDLTDRLTYNSFISELKIIHSPKGWRDFIDQQIYASLDDLLTIKEISEKFAKTNSDRFEEETAINLYELSPYSNYQVDQAKITQMVKFCLNNITQNKEYKSLISKFNLNLLEEFKLRCNPQLSAKHRTVDAISSGLIEGLAYLDNPVTFNNVIQKHGIDYSFLDDMFQKFSHNTRSPEIILSIMLQFARQQKRHQETLDMLASISNNLLPWNKATAGESKTLYTNYAKSYRIFQIGTDFFLQSGRPFILINDSLLTKIGNLYISNEATYTLFKNKLNIDSRYQQLMSITYDKNTPLLESLASIVTGFAENEVVAFVEFCSDPQIMHKLGLPIANFPVAIQEVINNPKPYLSHLLMFFLLNHEMIMSNLLDLNINDPKVLLILSDARHLKLNNLNMPHIDTLSQVMHLIRESLEYIKELRETKPWLTTPSTSITLLNLFKSVNELRTYGLQCGSVVTLPEDRELLINTFGSNTVEKLEQMLDIEHAQIGSNYSPPAIDSEVREKVSFNYAVRDNAFGFHGLVIDKGDLAQPQGYIRQDVLDELEEKISQISDEEIKAAQQLNIVTRFHPIRLMYNVPEEERTTEIQTLADHYINRLKLFYTTIGLAEEDIPERPVDEYGEQLAPVIGLQIKQFLRSNAGQEMLQQQLTVSQATTETEVNTSTIPFLPPLV
jgi:hypothetical protein